MFVLQIHDPRWSAAGGANLGGTLGGALRFRVRQVWHPRFGQRRPPAGVPASIPRALLESERAATVMRFLASSLPPCRAYTTQLRLGRGRHDPACLRNARAFRHARLAKDHHDFALLDLRAVGPARGSLLTLRFEHSSAGWQQLRARVAKILPASSPPSSPILVKLVQIWSFGPAFPPSAHSISPPSAMAMRVRAIVTHSGFRHLIPRPSPRAGALRSSSRPAEPHRRVSAESSGRRAQTGLRFASSRPARWKR